MTPLDPGSDEQFNDSFEQVVHLGNRLANDSQAAELWDIADGILAGAVQFWLYSRQPCGDRSCEDCAPVSTAEGRMAELLKNIRQFAEESEYFHSPTDSNAGRA